MKKKVSLPVLILAILVISSSALGLGVDVGSPQEQTVIRAAYAELERYADGPVHDLSFEVSDFETLGADRFDEVFYADLVTWPVGDLIGIEFSTRSLDGSGPRFIHYIPRWESGDFDWSSPEGRSMTGLTVAEVFRQLRREQPDWEEVESITRYRVTVHLHGKSRTYRASFFWLSNSGGSTELRFRPFDLVTQGLSAAVSERLPTREEALRAVEKSPGADVGLRFDLDAAASEAARADAGGEITDSNGTPIVVDLAGDGFRFTSAEDGVHFDLDRDRFAEQIAWTTEGGDDAFLVADWNGNGTIDHGGELFGDRSGMPATVPPSERHGYSALAQWDDDDAGGNQDGWVSADDLWYERFWLWLDSNHNGVSEPDELFRLEEYGIQAIDLSYVDARRRDRHGNVLRFTSEVSVGDGPRRMLPGDRSHTSATDVFLLRATD